MERAEDIFLRIKKEGEKVIDEFIITRKSEELFLDFKRSANNGDGSVLHSNDRNNLAKAISGFGNSEGGVVVWGIDCSKDFDGADVAQAKHSIKNVKKFVSWIEGAVSGCTIPPHSGVKNYPLPIDKNGNGFVITYIPKSNRVPHQTVGGFRYYIRAGSSFVPTPHGVLAGMFGRHPQPNVFIMFVVGPANMVNVERVNFEVGFLIRNQGPGIAKDPFINVMIYSAPGENCDLGFKETNLKDWTGQWSFGRHISLISKPEIRIAPESHLQPLIMTIILAPPFSKAIRIEGICGCGNAPPSRFTIENTSEEIKKAYEKFVDQDRKQELTQKDRHKFVEDVLKVQASQKEAKS